MRGSIGFKQAEAVVGTLRTISETFQHTEIGDIEGGGQKVSHLTYKLGQNNLHRSIQKDLSAEEEWHAKCFFSAFFLNNITIIDMRIQISSEIRILKTQHSPVYVEAFVVPFPGRILAGRCVGETLWDTRTPDPTQAQMIPYCKTLQSERQSSNQHCYPI